MKSDICCCLQASCSINVWAWRMQAVIDLCRRLLKLPTPDRGLDMVRVGKRLAELNMQQACTRRLLCQSFGMLRNP